MWRNKGQAAIELLIVLAIAISILLVIIVVNNEVITSTSANIDNMKSRSAVDSLGDAAEMIYQQGVGSRTKVHIVIPDATNFTASDNVLSLDDTYRTFDFNISGSFELIEGNYWYFVEAKEGYVEFSQNINSTTVAVVCGNDDKEDGEVCDGSDLNSETCVSQGFDSGNLTCLDDCSGFNTSECVSGDSVPPSSISGLDNQSHGPTWIYWNWSNPVSDFSEAIVYLDAVNVVNTSNNYYNVTGLEWNSSHTIIVHTKDADGNVNNSDVADSASTKEVFEYSGLVNAISCFKDGSSEECDGSLTVASLQTSNCNPPSCGYADIGSSDDSYLEMEFGSLSIPNSTIDLVNVTFEYADEKTSFNSQELKCYDGSSWVKITEPTVTTSEVTTTYTIDIMDCINPYAQANDVKLRFGQFSPYGDSGKVYFDYVNLQVFVYDRTIEESSGTQVFSDDFESGGANPDTNFWDIEEGTDGNEIRLQTSVVYDGSYAMEMEEGDEGEVRVTTDAGIIDLSDYSECNLSMWIRLTTKWESSDTIDISLYDGSWDSPWSINGETYDTGDWYYFSWLFDTNDYTFDDSFRFRIDNNANADNEEGHYDDVELVCT